MLFYNPTRFFFVYLYANIHFTICVCMRTEDDNIFYWNCYFYMFHFVNLHIYIYFIFLYCLSPFLHFATSPLKKKEERNEIPTITMLCKQIENTRPHPSVPNSLQKRKKESCVKVSSLLLCATHNVWYFLPFFFYFIHSIHILLMFGAETKTGKNT